MTVTLGHPMETFTSMTNDVMNHNSVPRFTLPTVLPRARKASYVADPIQQGTAPKKAKKGAGDQGQGQGQQGGDADMATTPRGKTAATLPGKGATPTPGRRGVSRLAGMRR